MRRRKFQAKHIQQRRARKPTYTYTQSVVGDETTSLPTARLQAQEADAAPVWRSQRAFVAGAAFAHMLVSSGGAFVAANHKPFHVGSH
jgi:hypothetical protein